jgi:histidine ammonia-lyase
MEHAARVSLRSVSDNPVYVPPDERHPLGRVISTGGYHNGIVYPAMSMLSAAWADLAFLAERHVTAMHVGATADHLPRLLERPDGGGGRTNLLGWVAGSYLEDARQAASVTLLPAGLADAQNDVAAPTFAAYRKARAAGSCLDASLALLAASSSQALWATDREPAPSLRAPLENIRSMFPPLDDPAGRRLGDELDRLAHAIGASTRPADGE